MSAELDVLNVIDLFHTFHKMSLKIPNLSFLQTVTSFTTIDNFRFNSAFQMFEFFLYSSTIFHLNFDIWSLFPMMDESSKNKSTEQVVKRDLFCTANISWLKSDWNLRYAIDGFVPAPVELKWNYTFLFVAAKKGTLLKFILLLLPLLHQNRLL